MSRYAATAVLLGAAVLSACSAQGSAPRATPKPTVRSSSPSGKRSRSVPLDTVPAADRGTILTRMIPVPRSGFRARPTLIYLPAIARRDKSVRLPVIELLHGTPGGPSDWIQKGGMVSVLDSFAARHGGNAPVVVLPDINGADRADTECISDGKADVEGYLSTEVTDYVIRNFPVTTDRRQWAVAGNSEGGSCSVMLALRHPAEYRAFGDMSGLANLTVGRHEDAARTIQALFDGSRTQYLLHDPLWLLQHHPDNRVSAWFRSGTNDSETSSDQALLAAAARQSGLPVDAATISGGHGWAVWNQAFAQFLSWFWSHAQ